MRLLSYNTHGCVGRGGHFDPDAVCRVIAESRADVVALQEVERVPGSRDCLMQRLEQEFAEVLYGPTMERREGDYGNILLSRWPVESDRRIDLSVGSHEPRGAVRAIIRVRESRVDITATHLGLWPGERREQVRRLVADHREHPPADAPVATVLMGDFNEWWLGARLHRRLHREFGRAPLLRTFPARFPIFALDRILVKAEGRATNWSVMKTEAARTASDHRPLLAELDSA